MNSREYWMVRAVPLKTCIMCATEARADIYRAEAVRQGRNDVTVSVPQPRAGYSFSFVSYDALP